MDTPEGEGGDEAAKPPSQPSQQAPIMSLQKAIDLGEYDPKYLAKFDEWHTLSRHIQFQLIRQAIKNRDAQLSSEWAAVNNMLDFSQKPHLQETLRNIEKKWKQLQKDAEDLYVEFSKD